VPPPSPSPKKHDFDVLGAQKALIIDKMPAEEWVKTFALGLLKDDIRLRLEMVAQTEAMEAATRFGEVIQRGLQPVLTKATQDWTAEDLRPFVQITMAGVSEFLMSVTRIVTQAKAQREAGARLDAQVEALEDLVLTKKAEKLRLN
jgi:hypothetical protein